jgi:RNA polymerase sigma-70 factor (ECF subfamily)
MRAVDDDPWRAAYEAARAQWPSIGLGLSELRELGRSRGLGEKPAEEFLRDFYLTCAVLAGDQAALAIFDAQFVTPARSSIERVHRAPEFVDDVLQELRRRLLLGPEPRLARYTGRSPLQGWIRVTATRLAFDLARADVFRLEESPDQLETVTAGAADPDLELLRRTVGPFFQTALRETLAALSARERNVLRMHAVQDLPIDQIALPYRIHRATAARWLNEIKRKVLNGVRARVRKEHPALSQGDLDSLQRLVLSQLHLSLAAGASRSN